VKLFRLLDPLFALERRLSRRESPARGVLLIAAGGLGDTVLVSLVIERFAALAQPGEPVTLLLRSDAAKMGFLFPAGLSVESVDFAALTRPGRRRAVLADLYRRHFRLVVSLDFLRHPDLDEALAFACAAPETWAMAPRPWAKYDRRLAANRTRWTRLVETGPVRRDKLLRLADFAGTLSGRVLAPPRIALPVDRMPAAVALNAPTVVIQPFSAVRAKQSPPEMYRRIIARLPAGWRVKIAGHPTDLDRNPDYRPLLDLDRVSFEPAPFAQLAGILRTARLVVSVDTACMHLAAVLGAPTLCLASAAYVGEIVPYAAQLCPPNVRFLWQPMPCEGCLGDCARAKGKALYPCVAALDADRVVAALDEMIEAGP
jgi:ADP-heptose:LPS heptosyltransferase